MADELEVPMAEGAVPEPESDVENLLWFDLPDDQLLLKIKEWLTEDSKHKAEITKRRKTDWKMYGGDQWEEATGGQKVDPKKPRLTLNMLLTIIAAVEGEERTNRQEMKYYGGEVGDDGAAAGLNMILKWVMQAAMGEFALSAQFRSDIVCGEGWIAPSIDYFEDPEGIIKLEHVDEDEMIDDCMAKCPVSSDSRRLQRSKLLSDQEIFGRWPDKKDLVRSKAMSLGMDPSETDGKGHKDIYCTPNDTGSMKLYDAQKKMWAVMESWWWQIEDGMVMVDEVTGMLVEVGVEEFEEMKVAREQEQQAAMASILAGTAPVVDDMGMPVDPMASIPPALQATKRKLKIFYQAFWIDGVLLEKKRAPLKKLKRFVYVPARAIWDKSAGEWKGLVRFLIDAQRQHNVEQSVIVQLMQLMPKQGWMAPKGAFHNKHEWETKLAQPGAMLEYNEKRGKPEPIKVPDLPRHLIDMAFTRPQAMREISGVNVDMMGQRVASDPGVVMEMRQKAAKTVLAPIFDNYRQTKIALGKVLLAFIQEYVKPGRRLRVLGEEGAQYVEMTLQNQIERYDIAVEETNSTVNDRIATLTVLQTTLPQMAKAGIGIVPEFIDLMPMPPHVRDPWKRQIAWEMLIAGRLPPPDWQIGMPDPRLMLPAPAAPESTEAPPQ